MEPCDVVLRAEDRPQHVVVLGQPQLGQKDDVVLTLGQVTAYGGYTALSVGNSWSRGKCAMAKKIPLH